MAVCMWLAALYLRPTMFVVANQDPAYVESCRFANVYLDTNLCGFILFLLLFFADCSTEQNRVHSFCHCLLFVSACDLSTFSVSALLYRSLAPVYIFQANPDPRPELRELFRTTSPLHNTTTVIDSGLRLC